MATLVTTAQAPPRQAKVTLDEFKRLRHDGYKAELVNGEVKMSPAGMRHERISLKLGAWLERFLEQHPLGHVYGSSAGYTLPSGDVRSPDISFVPLSRLPGGRDPDDYADFPPISLSRSFRPMTACVTSTTNSLNILTLECGWFGWLIPSDRR